MRVWVRERAARRWLGIGVRGGPSKCRVAHGRTAHRGAPWPPRPNFPQALDSEEWAEYLKMTEERRRSAETLGDQYRVRGSECGMLAAAGRSFSAVLSALT